MQEMKKKFILVFLFHPTEKSFILLFFLFLCFLLQTMRKMLWTIMMMISTDTQETAPTVLYMDGQSMYACKLYVYALYVYIHVHILYVCIPSSINFIFK